MGYTITLGKKLEATVEEGTTYYNTQPASEDAGETPAEFAAEGGEEAQRSPSYGTWSDVQAASPTIAALMKAGERQSGDVCRFQLPLTPHKAAPQAIRAEAKGCANADLGARLLWTAYWIETSLKLYGEDAVLEAR